ncbi:uncharacterized protein I206_104984 [Kwoniella pini CBS 10737]|uniref:Enhancer of polycomb-like protein n=1 Tax=Kwoniella pini CBS 10737 TaxID=1296096 RepID=A0A1B9I8E1_9TREE|nr:uncharacterized protein I206_02523 [Kwoniella pini CBS 10737]OCF51807.1 hypothetical protein I206_02523 [Kwoniella pini CBS 10737]
MAVGSRMVTSSRRAGRVTNKTKLLIYKGTDKIEENAAETIVWESNDSSASGSNQHSDQTKHQHVGAKGVESGELLEHHLQAALSSASLLHSSRSTSVKPASPNDKGSSSNAAVPTTTTSSLNYHIPTPDATGLVKDDQFAPLYQATKYVEPVNYIRFSDTVEESSGGWGGLGYCMDDKDYKWLNEFNSKQEGSSGSTATATSPQTPFKETNGNAPNHTPSAGRGMRAKGKEKEKDKSDGVPTSLFISEDTFEYIMGVLEKYAEDSVPMLHTNISLLPPFSSVEPLFASPIPTSFLPSNEIPKGLPDLKVLSRMARNVYPHWKTRREERDGKSIMPALNYDETNDNDPYVCFRRRDIRATRKTRRTDNYSIEQFQKIQNELLLAHNLSTMVVKRETMKKKMFKSEKEVWEAKWKLFEIKRKWPSLGMTREEEEIITGRSLSGVAPIVIPSSTMPLQSSSINIQTSRKKNHHEKEREDRDKRDKILDSRSLTDKVPVGSTGRSNNPDAIKERIALLQSRLDEFLLKKKESDLAWDDCTDNSYQPLPPSAADRTFRPRTALDPHYARTLNRGRADSDDDEDESEAIYPSSFRLRRGRGGVLRLDRRTPLFNHRKGSLPSSSPEYSDWLFPDTVPPPMSKRRPKSIDEVDDENDDQDVSSKRRKLNELSRYDTSRGGALGVGMGMEEDLDRVIVDDLDSKYIRNRISLLRDDDWEKLRPDVSVLDQAINALNAPIELPPTPVFVRPQIQPPDPQLVAAHLQQQQLLAQQQQMEQFQRFQLLAQQQALVAQQQQQRQQAAMAAAQGGPQTQGQGQAATSAQGVPSQQRAPSADATSQASPIVNGQAMLPPNGRPANTKRVSTSGQMAPPQQRPSASLSPTNSIHPSTNGSPQLVNGVPAKQFNGSPIVNGNVANANNGIDPALQQRILAARAMAAQAQVQAQQAQQGGNGVALPAQLNLENMTPEQIAEVGKLAAQNGFGDNLQGYVETSNKRFLLKMARMAQQQQAQQVQAQQAAAQQAQQQQQQQNGTNGNGSPALPPGGLNLKLPAHAAARLGAANGTTNGNQSPTPAPASQRV